MTLNDLPQHLSDSVAGALVSSTSTRRSFLTRVAVFGSALTVAPLRYLLRPGTAYSAIVSNCPQPNGCTSGVCTDGYSSFCCTTDGTNDHCPANTIPGGWWHACVPTTYCSSGTRYYIDCVGTACPTNCSACHCYNNSCGNRRVCCNTGYTNCGGSATHRLRCRLIRCQNPCRIKGIFSNCSCTSSEKDAKTCCHGGTCVNAPDCTCKTRTCTP